MNNCINVSSMREFRHTTLCYIKTNGLPSTLSERIHQNQHLNSFQNPAAISSQITTTTLWRLPLKPTSFPSTPTPERSFSGRYSSNSVLHFSCFCCRGAPGVSKLPSSLQFFTFTYFHEAQLLFNNIKRSLLFCPGDSLLWVVGAWNDVGRKMCCESKQGRV